MNTATFLAGNKKIQNCYMTFKARINCWTTFIKILELEAGMLATYIHFRELNVIKEYQQKYYKIAWLKQDFGIIIDHCWQLQNSNF